MKKILSLVVFAALLTTQANAQKKPVDKSDRASLPAIVSQHLADSVNVVIDYSKPMVKGRTIGKDLEPMDGKVWRTGANEATWFQTDKDITVDGKKLPAGKYGFFTVFNGDKAILIFNKVWDQWGAFSYKIEEDALRVNVPVLTQNPPAEQLSFSIGKQGKVEIQWGPKRISFQLK